ncbi:MAG: VOC family protein [Bacteroidetes bacterium]|nr:VOC family protein [Bacteroidota bacterium]
MITGLHHIAIICSDYNKSKHFYHEILGFEIIAENYRAARNSWKLDLRVNAYTAIELFSLEDAPPRLSYPEGRGLRHICFSVKDLDTTIKKLSALGITFEAIRTDEYTGKRFVFFADPDDLPIELYEQ